jgi:hypothetical protein
MRLREWVAAPWLSAGGVNDSVSSAVSAEDTVRVCLRLPREMFIPCNLCCLNEAHVAHQIFIALGRSIFLWGVSAANKPDEPDKLSWNTLRKKTENGFGIPFMASY